MEICVYQFFGMDGTVLYVGVTTRGVMRWANHAATKRWWPLVKRAEVEHFETLDAARARERELIEALHPAFNVVHNTGRDRSYGYRMVMQAIEEGPLRLRVGDLVDDKVATTHISEIIRAAARMRVPLFIHLRDDRSIEIEVAEGD